MSDNAGRYFKFTETTSDKIQTPPAGQKILYYDTTGLKVKDSGNVISGIGGGSSDLTTPLLVGTTSAYVSTDFGYLQLTQAATSLLRLSNHSTSTSAKSGLFITTYGATTNGGYIVYSRSGSATTLATGPYTLSIYNNNGSLKIGTTSGSHLILYTNGTQRITVESSGTVTINSGSDLRIGYSQLSTSAASGFLRLPTCAGTPVTDLGTSDSFEGNTPLVVDTTNYDLYVYNYNSGAWKMIGGGSGGGGGSGANISGSTGYILKFTGATAAGNSVIYETSSNIGIGTTTPSSKLDVNGTITTTNLKITSSPTSGYYLRTDASGNATWVNALSGTVDYLGKFNSTNTLNTSRVKQTSTTILSVTLHSLSIETHFLNFGMSGEISLAYSGSNLLLNGGLETSDTGYIKTGESHASGGRAQWKLGKEMPIPSGATNIQIDTTKYLEVAVDGLIYKLALVKWDSSGL